jgi:hypothetical protein
MWQDQPRSTDSFARETPDYRQERRTDDQERNAMRAFLQRTEVRLSTMHRVAVGFISGAGLLFLFPVFFKDAILAIVKEFLTHTPSLPPNSNLPSAAVIILTYLLIGYPFLLSLGIPIMALGLLLRDIVHFYFVGHPPGFAEELFNPRFGLSAIAFSPDESESTKTKILIHQYGSDLINFVLPFDERGSRYYGAVIDKPKRMIVPTTRRIPRLIGRGILDNPNGKTLDQMADSDVLHVRGAFNSGGEVISVLAEPYKVRTLAELDRFNAALGLAGFIDRPLYQEVAKQEVSLVRHSLKLRQMVLRYFQALLVLLWTALVSFGLLPFLQDEQGRFAPLFVFAFGYLIWAILTPIVVQLPIRWLLSHTKPETRRENLRRLEQTDALKQFENWTGWLCYVAIVASLLAIFLEIVLRVR